MTLPVGPRLDERRTPEFLAELRDRARAWIPSWDLADGERDFGLALLEIAARFNSEVAERLDRGADKMQRGFFDWLAVRGQAARPSRMPVVFGLGDTATGSVLATNPVRLQADANGTAVAFETETDLRVVPGRVDVVVAVDADNDAFYLPWPGLTDLQPLEPLPTQWQAKSFASVGAIKIQLDPDLGLDPGTILEASGQHYRIVQVDKDLVTIEPPLAADLAQASSVTKVTAFAPFDGVARNWQEHALYLGDGELLNVESEATIEVVGSLRLRAGFTWEYWGKSIDSDEARWRPLPLDDERQDAIVLEKPKGAMEQREIAGKSSRWIRAYTRTIAPTEKPITTEAFALRINSSACGSHTTVCPPIVDSPLPSVEAMANTTPLVLDNVFLPLGREPRQFDAFYLGSAEAFSKKGAQVRICFELADPTFESLAVVRGGGLANTVLAGVGKDHALHIFQFSSFTGTLAKFGQRDALRPPAPGDNGAVPERTASVSLHLGCRPTIRSTGNDFYIDVAAGGSIWTWHENALDPKASGWLEFDPLPPSSNPARQIDDIVPVAQADTVVVLSDSELWVHDGIEWAKQKSVQPAPDPNDPDISITLVALVPVVDNTAGDFAASTKMVGVSDGELLYQVELDGTCTPLPLVFGMNDEEKVDAAGIRPAAYSDGAATLAVVTANAARDKLVAYVKRPAFANPDEYRIEVPAGHVIDGATVEVAMINGTPQFSVLCKTPSDATYVASWQPLDQVNADVRATLFRSPIIATGRLNGPPVTLPTHLVAPGARGDLFVAAFDSSQRRVAVADAPEDGVVLPQTTVPFVATDVFSVVNDLSDRVFSEVASAGLNIPPDPQVLYPVTPEFGPVASDPELLAYRHSAPQYNGTIVDVDTLTLDGADLETGVGTVLLIDVGGVLDLHMVVDDSSYPNVTVQPPLSQAAGIQDYWRPEAFTARVAPIVRLDPVSSGGWDASLVARTRLYFQTATPEVQTAKAFELTPTNRPVVLALQTPWEQAPAAGDTFIIDGTLGEFRQLLADNSSNPELSWEYSNGNGWGSLILEEEGTLHLKNTGAIRFRVPRDMAPSDWAGKTNHWIRARLIGGDYGREKVTVTTTNLGNNNTEQSVERSTEGIRPPLVMKLHVSFGFCDEIRPSLVVTEDSGSFRDQSDANGTLGAIVEAFVPLAVMLGDLFNPASREAQKPECPPGCDCHSKQASTAKTTSSTVAAVSSTRASGRSLFVGLTREPSGEPVNVLMLVDQERDYTRFAPLGVAAHVADRFVPVVADDDTRGLGESGLLSLAFTVPPTPRELFGRTLSWLQLAPTKGTIAEWAPTLRGVYLNGVWAAATETLTRELVGSSDGAPNLTVKLARPPVLEGTLELRVREPLGEEERAQLREKGQHLVLSKLDGLPGDWVLWKQVTDPADESPVDRVYALDESKGMIRFGDGRHGAIPPIGVDSIVAFSYQRTETGAAEGETVPGNQIAPRSPLNLVSPVDNVESVIAADQSAGGAPPESPERVLRFGLSRLRHRNRAVSARDIEDLALQSSPDIVQAHVFARRDSLRLVVVMKGKDPVPDAGQVRELRRLLLDTAPATLSAPNALKITGPQVRRLRLALTLRVASLDHAGAVSRAVKQQLAKFFDTATGGTHELGWPLGLNPSADDVAYALIDTPLLESLGDVTLREVTEDGGEGPWPAVVRADALVMLAADPVRLSFQSAEAAA